MLNKTLLILFVLLLAGCVQAQIIGGNGEGISDVVDEEDISHLKELTKTHPIAMRWPGGGDSKVTFLDINTPGLGMNADSIKNLYDAYPDRNGEIRHDKLEKDLKKVAADQAEKESALMSVIRLSHEVKDIKLDYCLNVLQGTIESNLGALQTLLDSGVNVISIVAGNETFYSFNYDWERYRQKFEPLLKECQKRWPEIPRLLCIGQELTRDDHAEWNSKLFAYIKQTGDLISGVDIHYYMAEELKPAINMHPKTLQFTAGTYYPDLEAAFKKYIDLYRSEDEMGMLVNYLKLNLPGKIYHCTEFNDKDAELWSNTIANGAHMFSTFCRYRNDFEILLVQNFIANWYWAARRPVNAKIDLNPDKVTKINRIHWYSIQLANELPYNTPELKGSIKITQPGIYYYFFENAGSEKFMPDISVKNGDLSSYELHYITGKYAYSGAGGAGFMEKGSPPNLEVRGITVDKMTSINNIPYNSFGYVKIIVE